MQAIRAIRALRAVQAKHVAGSVIQARLAKPDAGLARLLIALQWQWQWHGTVELSYLQMQAIVGNKKPLLDYAQRVESCNGKDC